MHQSLYVYGIAKEVALPTSSAEANPDIYVVPRMGCSAIVTNRADSANGEYDRESFARMHLEHQTTLERLLASGMQLIPIKSGTFVSSAIDAAGIIEDGYKLIDSIFRETEDAHELDVIVTWSSFPSLLQQWDAEGDVQELKRVKEARQPATTEDAIAVGRLIKEKIDQRNATVGADVFGQLGTWSMQSKRHDSMDGDIVLNAAFLVNRLEVDAFVGAVEALDRRYQHALHFRIVGPLPCYSFFTLELRELSPGTISEARSIIGLEDAAGEEELKKAGHLQVRVEYPDRQAASEEGEGSPP
ncbi:MAG: hypothetical protein A3K90_03645 [Pelodictyon luteolum]|uniref:GvpL/GvpF family gas vesicle protein n=1 Tax=Pelodictyon luteolum TaxID=1100 RepID=A0A165LDM4_PELLU|nr:GvpL/GvpF family gas vesicle protein [Pelodictyon luteolum]KZK73893.1 MAG: hypothetical protein A3K90_03645 [Pelodictyon luteolum]